MPAADGDKGASGAQHTPLVVCARCSSLLLAHSCSQNMYGAIFHSVSVPDISASTYLSRHLLRLGLAMKDEMTEATVLHLLVLLDRLHTAEASSGFHLCSANVHRVLLALIVISAKLVDDEPYTNALNRQLSKTPRHKCQPEASGITALLRSVRFGLPRAQRRNKNSRCQATAGRRRSATLL